MLRLAGKTGAGGSRGGAGEGAEYGQAEGLRGLGSGSPARVKEPHITGSAGSDWLGWGPSLALAEPVPLLRLPRRSLARTLAVATSHSRWVMEWLPALVSSASRWATERLPALLSSAARWATERLPALLSSAARWASARTLALAPDMRCPVGAETSSPAPNPPHHASTRAAALSAGLCIAAAVSGCVVGPQYKGPPATNLTDFHNNPALETRQTAAPAPPVETWWTGFRDPVLSRIVERALAQNLDLAAAIARVDQARAVAREAGAQLLPTAAATGSVSPLRQSLNSPIGSIGRYLPGYERNQTLYDADVGAQWEIDLFGGLRRGAEAARDEAEAAEAQQLGVRVSVVADAADAYFQARGDQARLAIAQSQVETDTRLLELVRLRFSRGASAEKEVAQAEALLAQARATIPPLRTALEAQLNRLDVLMGAQPGTYAAELSKPTEIPAAPAIPPGQRASDLLRRRPDVIAAERRLAASNARIGIAIAEYYPKVSLSALLGFESLSASHLWSAESFQPEATAGLRWRLFDFGKVDAEVAQANSANAQVLLTYRQTVLRATEDVENAFMALAQLELQTHDLANEVDALARARDASQQSYLAGASSLTDVLDADRQSLVAQDELARARADTDRAAVMSFRALGGGWSM
jgi:NodT family efflux transporter outer membrane factor (OMF) lipoprotein